MSLPALDRVVRSQEPAPRSRKVVFCSGFVNLSLAASTARTCDQFQRCLINPGIPLRLASGGENANSRRPPGSPGEGRYEQPPFPLARGKSGFAIVALELQGAGGQHGKIAPDQFL
jgi:hypothetical protein